MSQYAMKWSLRSLLVIVAILCGYLAVCANRAAKQRDAVALVERLGGRIQYSWKWDRDGNVRQGLFGEQPSPWIPQWLQDLTGSHFFYWMRWVDLENTQVTDEQLDLLSSVPTIVQLDLSDTGIGNEGLANVRRLPHLRRLNLYGTQIDDAGMEHVRAMSQLVGLNVGFTKVTNAGLGLLADESAAHEASMLAQLDDLNVAGTKVDHAGFEMISKHGRRLRSLTVTKTAFDDEAAKRLVAMPELVWLFAEDCGITDEGLGVLAKAPAIRNVLVRETAVSKHGVMAFLQLVPAGVVAWGSVNQQQSGEYVFGPQFGDATNGP